MTVVPKAEPEIEAPRPLRVISVIYSKEIGNLAQQQTLYQKQGPPEFKTMDLFALAARQLRH